MVQPEILLSQLQTYSGRPGVTNILDAWEAYFDAHGVFPYASLIDRAAYHAYIRGITVSDLWAGNITVPSQVLISASPGFAYDVSNVSSLWQDVAGTVPVTEAGDPVARIDDVSSQGNHALQADVNKQPTYQVGTDGRPYLLFDGVDDFMVTPAIDLSASTAGFALAAILREGAAGTDALVEQSTSPGAALGSITLFLTSTQARAGVTTNLLGNTFLALVTNTSPHVWSAQFDFTASTPETAIPAIRLDRYDQVAAATFTGTGTAAGVGANAEFYIAGRGGIGQFLGGRFYGAVARGGALTLQQHKALEDYYAERAGA